MCDALVCCFIPGLNGAEESGMIEENIGFISCIGRGVKGVNVPPETGCFYKVPQCQWGTIV